MSYISKSLRNSIAEEAQYCCAYCQTSQHLSGAQMHIEHIIPLVKDGTSTEDNLCLSCAWCKAKSNVASLTHDSATSSG